MHGDAALQAIDLTSWRGETCVLDDVSASLSAGQILQVVGPNGSGKTTLLRTLAGLALPDHGQVLWRGRTIEQDRSAFQSQLLYLGHKAGVSGALTPRENLLAYLHVRQVSPDLTQLDEVLDALALGERKELPCRWLSAGQQRRVALARLVLEPATLWILDEPLNALDVDGIGWVVERIEDHAKQGGMVLFTTHQPMPFVNKQARQLLLTEAEMAS
jgi:heme exporter protein A